MHASDVMTNDVITVSPDTSVQDLAALLGKHGISGAPVVDAAHQLVGIVSEGSGNDIRAQAAFIAGLFQVAA